MRNEIIIKGIELPNSPIKNMQLKDNNLHIEYMNGKQVIFKGAVITKWEDKSEQSFRKLKNIKGETFEEHGVVNLNATIDVSFRSVEIRSELVSN